jgi:DNA-binding GntR family transcriptional regulator
VVTTSPLEGAEVVAGSLDDRIVEVARQAVADGRSLPGEPALATLLGVSRPALREALARLEHGGLIGRRRGAGTTVNPGALELGARFDQQVEFADVLSAAGYVPSLEVLERGIVPLSSEDAEVLHAPPGVPALRTVKRWRADGRAAMVAIDVVPLPPSRLDAVAATAPEVGLFELMRRVLDVPVEWELAWPGASATGSAVSRWLEVPPRSAVMTLDLIGVARSGERVYRAQEHLVPGVVRAGFVRTVRS